MDHKPLYQPKCSVIALMALAMVYPVAQAGEYGAVGPSSVGTSGYYYSDGSYSDITSRARARRDERIQAAMSALDKGRAYYKEGKYEEALQEYKTALDTLPKAPATEERRDFIVKSVGDASVAVAQEYTKVGRYDEARQLLMEALKINPDNKLAQRQLEYLDDPIRSNPAKTPQYVKDVEEVNKLLHMAYGYYELGQYDQATKLFDQVLLIDKYNKAARRGQETVNRRKLNYFEAAHDEARGRALLEVTAMWESIVPVEMPGGDSDAIGQSTGIEAGVASNTTKLRSIIIPSVDFEDTPVEDAIQFLRKRSVDLDTTPGSEGQRGINFVINDTMPSGTPNPAAATMDLEGFGDETAETATPAPAPVQDVKSRRIKELKLRDVPMIDVLQYICQTTGLRYKIENYAVTILPSGADGGQDIHTKSFPVPGNFISQLEASAPAGGGGGEVDPFATSTGGSSLTPRRSPVEIFKTMGISFGEGCSATYIPGNSVLVVRNTMANIDLIEQAIENTKGLNKQIKILAKFVEISQDNTDELSFDWTVTPMSINNARSAFMGGGTSNGTTTNSGDFVPNPGGVSGWPISSTSDEINGLATGGLRSGTGAISKNNMDSLTSAANRSEANQTNRAPGILSMTGIYSEGAFQMIMRGLSQKKGADILTAPSILARPGEPASIEIIREFIYPTNYDPPQLPNNVGGNYRDNGNYGYAGLGSALGLNTTQPTVNSFPVTPATPTEWEMRAVGVRLNVEPTVSQSDYVIDLRFEPELVEFEGFVNYGSPIQSTGVGSDGKPVSITLTENRIEMPIFSTRKVSTKIFVYDGYTVGIGGLISESVQTVEDKVPIFGDLPFVGRFFRSNAENHTKKNLMIFVTAQVVDATGQPIRGRSTTSATPEAPAMSGMGDSVLLPPTM